MGMIITGIKAKIGLAKKDVIVDYFMQNGKRTIFSSKLNAQNCIEVKNSAGEKRRILISETPDEVDNTIVEKTIEFNKKQKGKGKKHFLNKIKETYHKTNANGEPVALTDEDAKSIYSEKQQVPVVKPTNSFLDSGMRSVTLVEGKSGNVKPIDLVAGIKPSMEDKELNDLNEMYFDLGQAVERRKQSGWRASEKIGVVLTLVLLLGLLVLIWMGYSDLSMWNKLFEEGVKTAGSKIVAGGA